MYLSAALYKVHDIKSIEEIYNNAFLRDLIHYEHNGEFLHTILNEAFYAYRVLQNTEFDVHSDYVEVNDLSQITFDHTIDIHSKYKFKGEFYTYGILLLNSWCELDEVLITSKSSKQDLSEVIYKFSAKKDNTRYHYILNEVSRKLNWFLTVYQSEALTIPFKDACELLDNSRNNVLLHNLPKNPYVGFIIYESIVDKIYQSIPKESQLYKLTLAKFRKTQFSKALLNIGYIADSNSNIISDPINGCILGGLTEDAFFDSSFGTRKALN
jgi:hypothetical protein